MTIVPLLAGVYVSRSDSVQAPLVLMTTIVLSFLGYWMVRQMILPISKVSASAQNMAQGKWDDTPAAAPHTADEVQELTQSLQTISKNAKELLSKVENLSLKDKLTGLYNSSYIRERLDEEIQRAIYYQHPCSFAYIVMQNYETYLSEKGEKETQKALKEAVQIVSGSIREFDRAAHIGGGQLAIILPDINKKKCIELMQELGSKIADGRRLMPSIGISENPIDGVSAGDLYTKAQERAKSAKQKGDMFQAFA